MLVGSDSGIVEMTIKSQLDSDFDDILELIRKQRDDAVFDLTALHRNDDDGACQIWISQLEDNFPNERLISARTEKQE